MTNAQGGQGGNMRLGAYSLSAGQGGRAPHGGQPGRDGAIVLEFADGREALRIETDGFYVEGRKTGEDALVYAAFRQWLAHMIVETEASYVLTRGDDGVVRPEIDPTAGGEPT